VSASSTQLATVAGPETGRRPAVGQAGRAGLPASQRALLSWRSDEALARRFRAGDEAAFGQLYERHRRRVFSVALGVLGVREDAEDATQEAFASVAATLRRGPVRELRPWLTRVAHNAAIDVRRRQRRLAAEGSLSAPPPGPRDQGDGPPASVTTPRAQPS
jgi:DNA-directed RNA polymerase specialized sigma24 family protein